MSQNKTGGKPSTLQNIQTKSLVSTQKISRTESDHNITSFYRNVIADNIGNVPQNLLNKEIPNGFHSRKGKDEYYQHKIQESI